MPQVGVCTSFGGNQQFKPLRNFSEEAVCRVKSRCKFREHIKVHSQKEAVTPVHILGLMQPAIKMPSFSWAGLFLRDWSR